jgi:hypothetical protein
LPRKNSAVLPKKNQENLNKPQFLNNYASWRIQERLVTHTWDEDVDTEKPRSVAIDRAFDIPPVRFAGFLLTQLNSLDINIFKFQIKHHYLFCIETTAFYY